MTRRRRRDAREGVARERRAAHEQRGAAERQPQLRVGGEARHAGLEPPDGLGSFAGLHEQAGDVEQRVGVGRGGFAQLGQRLAQRGRVAARERLVRRGAGAGVALLRAGAGEHERRARRRRASCVPCSESLAERVSREAAYARMRLSAGGA